MRGTAIIGLLLIVVGIGGLVFSVISVRTQEPIVKIGPITAVQEKTERFYIPPVAAVVVLLIGGALLFVGRRA